MKCPVCKSSVSRDQGSDYGERRQIDCPRCGLFVITRTAIRMLEAHFKSDARSVARVSHAIRTRASHGDNEVDSTQVAKLLSGPLPTIERQIRNFLKWIEALVDDDALGAVELPSDLNVLAGVIGTIDGERVDELISLASQDGLIKLVPDNCVRLTRSGWQLIQSPSSRVMDELHPSPESQSSAASQNNPPAAESQSPAKVIKAHCPDCGPDRNADVVAEYSKRWDHEELALFTIDNYRILCCCGCGGVFVQHEHLFSENEKVIEDVATGEYDTVLQPTIRYWPAPARRHAPAWSEKISDETVRALIAEVYEALNADLRTIAAMGVRAALDKTFDLAGANPSDNFVVKLDTLSREGVIAESERAILLTMTDAGSAAAHRGWRPEPEELDSILDATEALLQRITSLADAATKLKARIPPRPQKGKRGQ